MYTVSNASKFYYDDVYVGPEVLDLEAPLMQDVVVIDDTSIDLLFNESVGVSSAQLTSNYEIQPSIGINTCTVDGTNPALIHISFVSPMLNGGLTPYFLTI